MTEQGAQLAFSYQSERLKRNVESIANDLGHDILIECDVASDSSIKICLDLEKDWNKYHGIIHSIGFAPANELEDA